MTMKSKFLKIAGVKSEKEFYKKYPTEEAFFNAHPEARSMKKGGSIEAFPQTITESNFFSYGVPAPPNYLKDGGMPTLYPQIQSEEQFFLPIYTNSHNAYAYGGTPEVFPQVGPVNYQPPVNMPLYMDEGGTATPPDQYPVQQGVNNTTGNFVNWLKNKSYNASEKEASKKAMGMFKNGGNHSGYGLPYMEPVRTIAQNGDAGKGNATTPSGLTQDDFNKYMNAWFQSQMGQSQQPMNDMRGFVPSLYAYNYDPRYKFTARNAQGVMGRGTSNMPLIHAMLPELYSGEKTYAELSKDPNFKNRLSALGLTGYSERDRGLFGKRKERTYTFGTPSQYNLDGKVGSGTLSANTPSNYTGPVTNNDYKSWIPQLPVDNSPLPGPMGMTFPSPKQSAPVTPAPQSWNPAFDENRMLGQISSNEANHFGTTQPNIFDKDWRNQVVQGDLGLYQGDKAKAAWESKVMEYPVKKQQWESFSDMPAPLKDIAGDHLFNSGTDPRTFMLAAAGVDKGYTGKGDAVIGNPEYRKWIRDNADQLWNNNKNLITQQYNDDPQAFTQAVTDHRNVLYSNLRTKTDDIPSNSGTPGLQYNAWSGRSNATQDYLNNAYFGPNTGYIAPQFFQRYDGGHQKPVTNFSSDPTVRKKQESYNKSLGYKSGGLVKAQGGFNFTPNDTPGDMPVNPMGVNPSGLTEEQMRNVVADDSFGINPTGKDYTTVTEKERGPFAGMFSDFNTNQFYKRAVTNALNSRNKPDTMLIEDTITGINPAMNFGQDPLSKKQMSNMFGNYAIQQDRGLYMKSGGQYSVGDEVEMTPEELQAFIQMGGQVDFI